MKSKFITIISCIFMLSLVGCKQNPTGNLAVSDQVVLLEEIEETNDDIPLSNPSDQESSERNEYPDFIVEAQNTNSDVIGWIKIPNTQINYPLVVTDNNDYYIDHNVEKKESKSGAIFLDYRNRDTYARRHLIIYGHNMKNGSMFKDLNAFKDKTFFDNNKIFSLWIFGEERTYEIYSQFIITEDVNYLVTDFTSDKEYLNFINTLSTQSKFLVNHEFTSEDEILTLSTCTYEYDKSRCVIQARRIV